MSGPSASERSVARRVVERNADVRAAVLLDAAGALLGAGGTEAAEARRLAELGARLVERADAASPDPIEQIEVQLPAGGVYAVRTPRHVLACVTRRIALPALVLYDLRHAMTELEAGG